MTQLFIRIIGLVVGLSLFFALNTAGANEFYRGKTIRFVVGLAPGGGYDLSARTTGRIVLDGKDDGRLIPFLIHRPEPDPEVQGLPLIPEVIEGEDNLTAYKTWSGSYEFQRPFTVPPGTPKERLQILRRAFASTLKDPEFIAEAEKSKLETTLVTGEEIDKYVGQILAITPRAKELLSFLTTKARI